MTCLVYAFPHDKNLIKTQFIIENFRVLPRVPLQKRGRDFALILISERPGAYEIYTLIRELCFAKISRPLTPL
jgi:hypothetical protein